MSLLCLVCLITIRRVVQGKYLLANMSTDGKPEVIAGLAFSIGYKI
jgi:hypothetical protein